MNKCKWHHDRDAAYVLVLGELTIFYCAECADDEVLKLEPLFDVLDAEVISA